MFFFWFFFCGWRRFVKTPKRVGKFFFFNVVQDFGDIWKLNWKVGSKFGMKPLGEVTGRYGRKTFLLCFDMKI